MAPPSSHVWRSVGVGSWQIHYPPYPRKSRAWSIDGEKAAARFVLKYAWELYLRDVGLKRDDCPIQGLM